MEKLVVFTLSASALKKLGLLVTIAFFAAVAPANQDMAQGEDFLFADAGHGVDYNTVSLNLNVKMFLDSGQLRITEGVLANMPLTEPISAIQSKGAWETDDFQHLQPHNALALNGGADLSLTLPRAEIDSEISSSQAYVLGDPSIKTVFSLLVLTLLVISIVGRTRHLE